MARQKSNPSKDLADKLLQALRSQKTLGATAYPLKLRRLAGLVDGNLPETAVLNASAITSFKNNVCVSHAKTLDAFVVLKEDMESLAGSLELLNYVLNLCCKEGAPVQNIAALKKSISPALRKSFAASITRRVEENSLPPSVGLAGTRKKPLLYLEEMVTLWLGQEASFVRSVERTRKGQGYAVTTAEMKTNKKQDHPMLAPLLVATLQKRIEEGKLPRGLGCIRRKKGKMEEVLLFLTSDVDPKPNVEHRTDEPFVRVFDEAFEKLNRQGGSDNFVSLVDMRRALDFNRADFDRELEQLRRAGRYSLRAAEGRFGTTPEQRDAGILEEGALLLYVSRNQP